MYAAKRRKFQKDGFSAVRFPFHPELFQVKSHGQEEAFCPDIPLSSGKKTAKSKVCLEQRKGPFHLNGTAQPQANPTPSRNILLGFGSFIIIVFIRNPFSFVCDQLFIDLRVLLQGG